MVCDRFFDSTVAYQAYGRGLEPAFIHKLNAFAVSGYRPDLTLYLDLPVDQAVARQVKRSAADRLEGAGQEFMSKVRTGYLELAKKEPARVKLVDASQTVELVRREIKQIVERYQNETSVCNCQ